MKRNIDVFDAFACCRLLNTHTDIESGVTGAQVPLDCHRGKTMDKTRRTSWAACGANLFLLLLNTGNCLPLGPVAATHTHWKLKLKQLLPHWSCCCCRCHVALSTVSWYLSPAVLPIDYWPSAFNYCSSLFCSLFSVLLSRCAFNSIKSPKSNASV